MQLKGDQRQNNMKPSTIYVYKLGSSNADPTEKISQHIPKALQIEPLFVCNKHPPHPQPLTKKNTQRSKTALYTN